MDLTLETVRAHVAVDHTEDDAYLTGLMTSALAHLENLCGRAIAETQVELYLDRFPEGDIELPWLSPVSVTAITYTDSTTLTDQTVPPEAYAIDNQGVYPLIYRTTDTPWPTATQKKRAVTISATLGWRTEDLPDPLVIAALLLIGTWYANRESDVIGTISSQLPTGVAQLIEAYKPTTPIG